MKLAVLTQKTVRALNASEVPLVRRVPAGGVSWLVSISRLLYRTFQLKRGLGRLVMFVARHRTELQMLPVEMSDGRRIYLDLREPMCMPYLLTGEIWEEEGETQFFRGLVHREEFAIDIGANVGWYSTLLSELVGQRGRVDAFEPNARAHRILVQSALTYPQLRVHREALGDQAKEVALHLPADGGMASLGTSFETIEVQKCVMTTLDDVLSQRGERAPIFIKCDAEGAELSILHGAERMLGGARPPLWMIEISDLTCAGFGYRPEAIIEHFKAFPQAGYRGYRVNSETGSLVALPPSLDFRFNAVFVPAWLRDRVAMLTT